MQSEATADRYPARQGQLGLPEPPRTIATYQGPRTLSWQGRQGATENRRRLAPRPLLSLRAPVAVGLFC